MFYFIFMAFSQSMGDLLIYLEYESIIDWLLTPVILLWLLLLFNGTFYWSLAEWMSIIFIRK